MGLGIYFNSSLQQIKSFSAQAENGKSLVMVNDSGLINARTGEMRVVTSTSREAIDLGYKKLTSAAKADLRNNVRLSFYDSICEQFGGEDKIPQALLAKLQTLKNPTGKALKNRDVKAVLRSVVASIKSNPRLYAANIFNGLKEIAADKNMAPAEKRSNAKHLLKGFLDQFNPRGSASDYLEDSVDTLADNLCEKDYKDGLNLLVDWCEEAMYEADPEAIRSKGYIDTFVEELKSLAKPYSLSAKQEMGQFVNSLYDIQESSYEEDTKKLLGKNLLLDFCAKMTPLGSRDELTGLYQSIEGDRILDTLVQGDKKTLGETLQKIFTSEKPKNFFPGNESQCKKWNKELVKQIGLKVTQLQSEKVGNEPKGEEQSSEVNSLPEESRKVQEETEIPQNGIRQQTIVLDKTQFHEETFIPQQAPDPIPEIKQDNERHTKEAVTTVKAGNEPKGEEQPSEVNSLPEESRKVQEETEIPKNGIRQQTIVLDKTQFHEETFIPQQAPDPIPEIKLDNEWHTREAVTTVKEKLHSIATSNLSQQEKTDSIRSYMDKVFNKAFPRDKFRKNIKDFTKFDFKDVYWIPPRKADDLPGCEWLLLNQLHKMGMKYLAETQTPYESPVYQFFTELE